MSTDAATLHGDGTVEFVTFEIGGRLFGAPVRDVHDVFTLQNVTPVPLARPDIAGLLNLRGRIVTVIDARRRLGLTPREGGLQGCIAIGLEQNGESFGLAVDRVGEVLRLSQDQFEDNPVNLDGAWREVSRGVYRLEQGLLIELDVGRMLEASGAASLQAA
jgi:purine-binding chemotaxis protein CheW